MLLLIIMACECMAIPADRTADERTDYVDESVGFHLSFYGSVYDYFRDNSNGKFCPKFDIVGPVKVDCSQ